MFDDPATRLLAWYDRHRRDLPWRAAPGQTADPYRVWLSEIMLQQTTVATVGPYFTAFLARWPTVGALAAAELDAVLHVWQGLGYYTRARNLHRCARLVATQSGGTFPDGEAALRKLPGIGPYTAAAIAAIAFGRPATPVDGNVERVIARLHRVDDPLPAAKGRLATLAARYTPEDRPGDHAQAMMDLGATICTPRRPACAICPLAEDCRARAAGDVEDYPRRAPKPVRPVRFGMVFWVEREDGAVLLERRPEKGLLGGMVGFPTTEWRDRPWEPGEWLDDAPSASDWRPVAGEVRHTFTHFHLRLGVVAGRLSRPPDGIWSPPADFANHALPTLMRKVAALALKDRS